jgi:4-amino-4-deoxy-L-arabinose transferase-like glycosyltransferase
MNSRFIPIILCTLAITAALLFSFWIYPSVAPVFHNKITGDGHDELGWGIYKYGTLAYYPDTRPTVLRGPIYPAFIAIVLLCDSSHYPSSVRIAQAIIHGFTTLLVFFLSLNLWGRRQAVVAALVYAFHPFVLWYCGRIVVEMMSTFLFTCVVFGFVLLCKRVNFWKSILMGIIIAVAALCKEIYLPFIVLVPIALFLVGNSQRTTRFAFLTFVVALLILSPWTVRNYQLTKLLIPVHTLGGYNFFVGDSFADNYTKSPLGYEKLVAMLQYKTTQDGKELTHAWLQTAEAQDGVREDRRLMQSSLERYMHNPLSLFQKIVLNSIMFWSLGATPYASIATILMQIPLLVLFICASVSVLRRHGAISLASIPIWFVAAIFLFHLPIYALARFSVVLIPTMISYAIGFIIRPISKIER